MADTQRNDAANARSGGSRRNETPEERARRKRAERAAQAAKASEEAQESEAAAFAASQAGGDPLSAANDSESGPKTGEALTPEEEAKRAERRARRKAREEKDRIRREKDLALLQEAETKKKEQGPVGNAWTLLKMAIGFGAGGWAIATIVFAILLGVQGGALTGARVVFALAGVGAGLYVGLYKRDLFKRIMDDE